jgi:hypothetical protein
MQANQERRSGLNMCRAVLGVSAVMALAGVVGIFAMPDSEGSPINKFMTASVVVAGGMIGLGLVSIIVYACLPSQFQHAITAWLGAAPEQALLLEYQLPWR